MTKIHIQYKLKDGTPAVGVTTLLSEMLGKSGALIHWAWKLGCEKQDYRKVRDKAGEIGTLTHTLIKDYLKGVNTDLAQFSSANIDKANKAFSAFRDFEGKHHLETMLCEEPLVSELGYGGTCDWYGKMDGELALLDFKTGNRLFPEMRLQVAA